jgi:hypothetical protein
MEHTSLELSKRLYDKGFRGEHVSNWEGWEKFTEVVVVHEDTVSNWTAICPAYTFTELWGVLPYEIEVDTLGNDLYSDDYGEFYKMLCPLWEHPYGYMGKTRAAYAAQGMEPNIVGFSHESPAEAAGLLLEWLIDEGHMKCEHGKGLTDYCQPCGRVNNG